MKKTLADVADSRILRAIRSLPIPRTDTRSMNRKEMFASARTFLMYAVVLTVALVVLVLIASKLFLKPPLLLLLLLFPMEVGGLVAWVGSLLMLLYGLFSKTSGPEPEQQASEAGPED